MKGKVTDVYNQLTGYYANEADGTSLYNTEYERPAMMAQMPADLAGLPVLDAGCAAGWYSEQLLNAGAKVTAVDFSPEMVKEAMQRTKGKAEVLCHDLEVGLPFEDQSFDLVVSSLTLHYLKEWGKTFQEFKRILKPAGQLLFSVHHPMTDIELLPEAQYFSIELLTDHWTKSGKTYEILFYRRPLSDILNSTLCNFSIEKVIEPKPTLKMKELAPESYARLMRKPQFLILKANKL
ncbi:class I SAM-dependent methyltransferase [Planococcus sp. N064]|uniref:Class I SAM-dependent methyltransferase n=1 Tax=Planococcus liqunii TaxID=3058394 RepID=A0ABT8MPE2_9BACL|nr:class I SAM-dependent methyltransferase [Planococcus sp. N064]MDN7226748.1 class I SAM-dependent methyltransferase [Planococcus sp. N064]